VGEAVSLARYVIRDAAGVEVKSGVTRYRDFRMVLELLEVRVLRRKLPFTLPLRIERVESAASDTRPEA
jgi:hypothetical protein